MTDAISARERLARLNQNRWQSKLALCFFAIAIILALMCENVNAAPQVDMTGLSAIPDRTLSLPAGAAPFMLSHPLCNTGFTIAMRYDERNSAGAIIKSVWVRKCVRVPRIVYGRKV